MAELQNELADKELDIKNSYKRIQDGQKNADFYRKETMKLDKDVNLLNADLQNLRVLEEDLCEALEQARSKPLSVLRKHKKFYMPDDYK